MNKQFYIESMHNNLHILFAMGVIQDEMYKCANGELKDLQDIGNYSYTNLSREFCIYRWNIIRNKGRITQRNNYEREY